MRTYLDCIPCFCRQALEAARSVTDDERLHEAVLREVLRIASETDMRRPPPAVGQRMHRLIRQMTGDRDPYRRMKAAHNNLAARLYPELRQRVAASADPLATAVRLAIAGNVFDPGPSGQHLTEAHLRQVIERALTEPLYGCGLAEFSQAAGRARHILYLADNAGEIVFDRLLIELLPRERVILAVRGHPVINDATLADARIAGLTDLVEVIDNGSDAPGTLVETCSEAFLDRFHTADMVIAKGQGNYETLNDAAKDIFFLLRAKCVVIARDLECEVGRLVLERSGRAGGNPKQDVEVQEVADRAATG